MKSSNQVSAERNRRIGKIGFLTLALFVIASCLTFAVVQASVSGELDPTFAGGRAVTDFFSLSVTSNEPVFGTSDGDLGPDWEIVDAHHVRLRAERAGSGAGRVYTITITCADSSGNSTSKSLTVYVPKSQS